MCRLQQEAVQQQLDTLQRVLEAKEAQMARLTKGGGQVRCRMSDIVKGVWYCPWCTAGGKLASAL